MDYILNFRISVSKQLSGNFSLSLFLIAVQAAPQHFRRRIIGNRKTAIIFLCCALFSHPVLSQFIPPDPVRTPTDIKINRTVPKNALAPDQPLIARFSAEPTDDEIFRVHVFEEPLVPIEGDNIIEENIALVYALATFSQRQGPDDFSAITEFLKSYPDSRWRLSLLTNLGIVYRKSGWQSRALKAWEEAWKIGKELTEPLVFDITNRALGELANLNASLGRYERLQSLFKEMEGRIIRGPATELLSGARSGLSLMVHKPELPFRCGPLALHAIQRNRKLADKTHEIFFNSRSTSKGISLTQLKELSDEAKMNMQMAERTSTDAELLMPSVIHWKTDHYAALIKEENGFYLLKDPTFGMDVWISKEALDEECSGYFLVSNGSLPKGWKTVSINEGQKIWGKGQNNTSDPKATSPYDGKCAGDCPGQRMASYSFHTMLVSLSIQDAPVGHTPPLGPPVEFNVVYNQREASQPSVFNYSNFGPKWTFDWLSYLADDPNVLSSNITLFPRGGGALVFTGFGVNDSISDPEQMTQDLLVRISPACYELRHADGSKERYGRPDGSTSAGRKIFLTEISDASGNKLEILYDELLRIVSIKDALGQVDTISYNHPSDNYKITKVTDPFGRFATFEYDSIGRLKKITDVIGITSAFKYDSADFIIQLITPYGTTKFEYGETEEGFQQVRHLQATDPMGYTERLEMWREKTDYPQSDGQVPVVPGIVFNNGAMMWRNSFYWNKRSMQEAPGDYSKAHVYHWLHDIDFNSVSRILESEKAPLENRIWYRYPNQIEPIEVNVGMSSQPSLIARVLDTDAATSTQTHKYEYDNSFGNLTGSTDPLGRKITYVYDPNQVDLLEVRQTTSGSELLAKFTFNVQHLPLTATEASGQVNTFTYNDNGQVTSIKNPKNETTSFDYENGYLSSITGPMPGPTVTFSYDLMGRVHTITDPEGYTIKTDYDALDRPTLITYPDSSYEQIVYDRLDAVAMRDRTGRWSHITYDSLSRVSIIEDAMGRISQFIWCSCGSLAEIVDPLGQITTWSYDLEGRVTSKTYADSKITAYSYESRSGRLKEITDAKEQVTKYSYFLDDNLKQVEYLNAENFTPSVSFTYDANYNRIASMGDGTGTTAYTYNPVAANPALGAGRLATIDGPLSNDVISYTYDSLGRIINRSIDGVASSTVFDALGRVTSATNALGTFTYEYINQTSRLASITLSNGQTAIFSYFNNHGDQRLKEIWNKKGNATISKFNYEYNPGGQITKWTQKSGNAPAKHYDLEYDLADQLIAATLRNQDNSIFKRYDYQYDKAGNRKIEQVNNSVSTATYNNINQFVSQTDGGQYRIKGTLDELSSIIISNKTTLSSDTAVVDTNNVFTAYVKVKPGNNNVFITGTDYSGNANDTIRKYKLPVTSSGNSRTLTFDVNGNVSTVTTNGLTVTYSWDAADRLIKIMQNGHTIEFIYDGLSRRVAEKFDGSLIKRWLWCGTEMCEERDAAGTMVNKRFFAQGQKNGSTKYFYTRDHLGSVHEVTNNSGVIVSRYDYDPYGHRTLVSGTDLADFGFTGHYFHKPSGLNLATFRAYDANLARWLSRDPLGEEEGLNLFGYVLGNPINNIDPNGLSIWTKAWKAAFNSRGISLLPKVWKYYSKIEKYAEMHKETGRLYQEALKIKNCPGSTPAQTEAALIKYRNAQRQEEEAQRFLREKLEYDPLFLLDKNGGINLSQIAAGIFLPIGTEMSQNDEASTSVKIRAYTWDIISWLDPIFLTDLIDWAAGL